MIRPVDLIELSSEFLREWYKNFKDETTFEKFISTIAKAYIWTDEDYICCAKYDGAVLFISYLVKLSNKKTKVKDFLRQVYNVYKPVFLMGMRGNRLVVYNGGKVKYINPFMKGGVCKWEEHLKQ